jgi:hypothetical protein
LEAQARALEAQARALQGELDARRRADERETAETAARVQSAQSAVTEAQARVDRVRQQWAAEQAARQRQVMQEVDEQLAREKVERERKAAEEQGKFQELYQATLTDLETERSTRRSLELAAMRRDVAAKLSLPTALADRLLGETPEELEADGKKLLAALPKPTVPNINAGTGNGSAPGAGVMSEDERKLRAAALGVDWRYFNP